MRAPRAAIATAGQVLCHNVDEFGGLWFVVTPEGDAVQQPLPEGFYAL